MCCSKQGDASAFSEATGTDSMRSNRKIVACIRGETLLSIGAAKFLRPPKSDGSDRLVTLKPIAGWEI